MRLSQVTRLGVVGVVVLVGAATAWAQGGASALAGRWDATVHANDVDAPFPFEIAVDGSGIKGTFFNGERRITSTPARLEGDTLNLRFEQYAATLKLTVKDGTLTGEYVRPRGAPYPFRATKAAARAASANPPSIDQEQQGRDRLAVHRQTEGRRCRRHDSARGRRHRHADRLLP
jgi:hypothetical protein